MFGKLLRSRARDQAPLTPRQGNRLLREESSPGEFNFTVKGQGRPGFFILFGAMFGGIPIFLFFAILFGDGDSIEGDFPQIFALLFLSPFILIGVSTFLIGLLLWLGITRINITSQNVAVRRRLFGKAFQQKEFRRLHLELSFEESHQNNDVPAYKLNFVDGQQKIGVGGSLVEDELLWLEREVKAALGLEAKKVTSVRDAVEQESFAALDGAVLEPNYRSKNLRFRQTFHGWEARIRSTFFGALSIIIFGSIFLIAGLMMLESSRDFLLDLVPAVRNFFSGASSSGGNPPVLFAMVFGGSGLVIVLLGIFMLGYRLTISIRDSRLIIERRWLVFSTRRSAEISDIEDLHIKRTGHVNNVARYRLTATYKNAETAKIVGFASAEDVAQLQAHLRAAIE
ncbi:MAG: hypothetical protein ACI8UO_001297 [Verrucomicrobiales bacterium]|jgi:hypothetical protein